MRGRQAQARCFTCRAMITAIWRILFPNWCRVSRLPMNIAAAGEHASPVEEEGECVPALCAGKLLPVGARILPPVILGAIGAVIAGTSYLLDPHAWILALSLGALLIGGGGTPLAGGRGLGKRLFCGYQPAGCDSGKELSCCMKAGGISSGSHSWHRHRFHFHWPVDGSLQSVYQKPTPVP